jgi:hypothetical protein
VSARRRAESQWRNSARSMRSRRAQR